MEQFIPDSKYNIIAHGMFGLSALSKIVAVIAALAYSVNY